MKLELNGKIIFLLLLFANLLSAQNVIVVVIDGARYTETFGDGNTNIPHMYDDMRPNGYLYTDFRIANAGQTKTNPGHASILTGTWQQIDNNGIERPTNPTIFEYIRKEDENPPSDCYAVTGKDKLDILTYSVSTGYGSAFGGTWVGDDDRNDALTYSKVISVMQNDQPKILLINFAEVDAAGHSGDWNNYITAITNADNIVYQLWQTIQSGTYGYTPENTTMFVTNDHGRHTGDDWKDHGDNCDGCEHIMLLAIGRNVAPGIENSDIHYQIELCATIGDLMGFDTPQSVGTSLYQGLNPLPVELSSFSAIILNSGIKLNWVTETEVNNYGFEIHRSQMNPDSEIQNSQFQLIGFVEGHGNSNSPKEYNFLDEGISYGSYAYRLKQIDNDGTFEYSDIIEVNAGNIPEGFVLEQNYPNPFNPSTIIKFALAESQQATLTVYDILGNEITQLFNESAEAGKVYEIEFNASDLPAGRQGLASGVYYYRLSAPQKSLVRKMLLLQ